MLRARRDFRVSVMRAGAPLPEHPSVLNGRNPAAGRFKAADAPRSGLFPLSSQGGPAALAGPSALLDRKPSPLAQGHRTCESGRLSPAFLDRTEGRSGKGSARASETGKEIVMAKPATNRPSARVVQLRKGATLEMVRLTCPDASQAMLIAESFGTAVIDGDGVREAHERLILETADSLSEGLGERAMQIHLQRIVGAFVGSAHGAGQFYSRAVTEARDATAKAANDARDDDRDGIVGYDSSAQRKREFAADMGIQAFSLRMAAEGAVAAYEQVVGEAWKPFDRPVENPGQSLDRKAADAQMAALG
jgi:hypothetical protein